MYLHEFAVQTHVQVQVFLSNLFCQLETHGAILVIDPPLLLVQENGLGMVDLLELCEWVGGWVRGEGRVRGER